MNAEPTLDLAGEMGMGTAQYHENTGADIAPRDMQVVGTSPSIRSRANIGPAVEERSSLVAPGEVSLLVRSGNQNAPEVDARLPGPYNWRKEGLGLSGFASTVSQFLENDRIIAIGALIGGFWLVGKMIGGKKKK